MWGLPKGRKQLAANIDAASAEVDTNAGEENEEIKPIGKGIFVNIPCRPYCIKQISQSLDRLTLAYLFSS